jgi:hypothetical protein
MILDKTHTRLLKDPVNIRNKALYNPEGYASDHKEELENLSMYERDPKDALYPSRNNSA